MNPKPLQNPHPLIWIGGAHPIHAIKNFHSFFQVFVVQIKVFN